jgi:hypothetical protein
MSIKRIPVDTAQLITMSAGEISGAFVRVRPLATTSESELKGLKERLRDGGARAVRVMPRPKDTPVQMSKAAELVLSLGVGGNLPTPRDTIFALIGASTSSRKQELAELFAKLADEEGL